MNSILYILYIKLSEDVINTLTLAHTHTHTLKTGGW